MSLLAAEPDKEISLEVKVMVGYSRSTGKYPASLHILGKLIFFGEYKSYKEAEIAEKEASGNQCDLCKDKALSIFWHV